MSDVSDDAIANGAGLREAEELDATPRLSVRLFGRVEVQDSNGACVLPRMRKARALFAVLAYLAPNSVEREFLATLLWGGRDREQARASLRQCLHELKVNLGDIADSLLYIQRNGVMLYADKLLIDTTVVRNSTIATSNQLDQIRGPLMQDLMGISSDLDRWIDDERSRISRFARTLSDAALSAAIGLNHIIAAAQRVLRHDPLNEAGWRSLMSAHAAKGEHAIAVNVYHRCVETLMKMANVSPSSETQTAFTQISKFGQHSESDVSVKRSEKTEGRSPNRILKIGKRPFRPINAPALECSEIISVELNTALFRFRDISFRVLGYENQYNSAGSSSEDDLDCVLDGSVYVEGGSLIITVRLLDCRINGELVWSGRFECARDNPILLGEVSVRIAAQLYAAVVSGESQRLYATHLPDLTAQQLVLRAIPYIQRLEKKTFLKAGELLSAAVKRDANYAAACAWSAYWHLLLMGQGWAENPGAAVDQTLDLTQRAIMLNPQDALSLTLSGHVQAFTHRRLDEGFALHERALAIHPGLALAWLFSGLAHTYSGLHKEGIRRIQYAKLLSPFDPHSFFFDMGLTLSHGLEGNTELAVAAGRVASISNPGFSSALKARVSALGLTGNLEEQAIALKQLLILEPRFTVTDSLMRSPLARIEDRECFADGLRRAGLPE